MNVSAFVDVNALISRRSLGGLQKLVLFFGFCIITLEGFDLTAMGFIIPALRQQWNITSNDLGPALSAAQIGLVLGAISAGPIADRLGRKLVLLTSMAIFGAATLLTATANDLFSLVLFRFLVGVGTGSVVPITATLVSEYVPERMRSLSVAFMICGVSFSATCAGFLSAWMIPRFGWQSVLVLGGLMPLLMIPALALLLPESVRFLVASRASQSRIRAIIDRLAPGETPEGSVFVAPAEPVATGATKLVFSAPYWFGGLMLGIAYFAALFASNILSHWLPSVIKDAGYSLSFAAVIGAVYHLGGVVGSLVLGWTMDRRQQPRVPPIAYLASAALFLAFGLAMHSASLLLVQSFVLGFCLIGAISCVNALPTAFYPTKARATGSCWMHGAGRCGAFVSIFSGAEMLTMGWGASSIFFVLAAPALAAGLALLAKERHVQRRVD